jgi:hypothetical protein
LLGGGREGRHEEAEDEGEREYFAQIHWITPRAALDEIKIVRTLPTGEKKEMSGIDLKAVMAGDRSQDVALRAQDVVVVPASGAKVAAYGVLDFLKGLFSIGITP